MSETSDSVLTYGIVGAAMNHPGFLSYVDEEGSRGATRLWVLTRLTGVSLFEIMVGEQTPSQVVASILVATSGRLREVAAVVVDLERVRCDSLSFGDDDVVDRVSAVIAALFEWLDLHSTD